MWTAFLAKGPFINYGLGGRGENDTCFENGLVMGSAGIPVGGSLF